MKTTVNSRGQTVVPAKIRKHHKIRPQKQLEWIDDGKTIRVVPISPDPIKTAKGSSATETPERKGDIAAT